MSGPLRLVEVAHASNTGRVRNHNEDRYLVRPPLLAVADGMGGAKAGEVAAEITVETLGGTGRSDPTPSGPARGPSSKRTAASARRPMTTTTRAGMGTTATAALLDDEQGERSCTSATHAGTFIAPARCAS